MADFRGDKKYAYYNFFMVGNAASKYKLQVAGYRRIAGDSILYGNGRDNLNGMAFSTPDNDNDLAMVTVHKLLREDSGTTTACGHN